MLTRREGEVEAQIRVATEALERASEEAKHMEVEEALSMAEEGKRLEVQRIAAERRIKSLERMKAKRKDENLRQEAELRKEAKLQRTKVETTEEGEVSGTGASEEEEARDKD